MVTYRICNALFVAMILSIFVKSGANFTGPWKQEQSTACLDFAIQLLKNVRDNYPVCTSEWYPMDCEELLRNGHYESGVYDVWPRSRIVKGPVRVYCDMDTDGGGWTVIQRRGDYHQPKDFFYQDWNSYKEGFGNIDEDFWLGNNIIYGLSNQRLCCVRFDLKDVKGAERYALYDNFWIDDEEHQYKLHIKGYSGDAGDSMTVNHNGQKFSTKNRDNDNEPAQGCAEKYKGGWWYNRCHTANLNGLYHKGKHSSYADGVNWHSWKAYNESLESTEIKIRGKDYWK